jgi:hypothetical protein
MKPIVMAALCFALPWCAGCRSDANRELLERELRDHEDQIYELQDQCDSLHHQLEACQHENTTLKKGGSVNGPIIDGPSSVPPRVAPPPPMEIPMPKIDLGTPDSAPPPPPIKKPSVSPGPANSSALGAEPASLTTEPPGPIERLAINRLMTGGHSFSGKPADDGLLVVFAARDSQGRPLQAAGEVSIVAIDPQVSGPAARVARWDFAAPEVAAHYRQGALVDAFHFDLLWPDRSPEHGELKLFVRLTTTDGRRIEDNLPIRVRLPGDPASSSTWAKPEPPQRWAPATLPSGAQFDPDADVAKAPAPQIAPQAVSPIAKRDPEPPASPPDGDPTPRGASRSRGWSPYR